jgi:hypothetical protein
MKFEKYYISTCLLINTILHYNKMNIKDFGYPIFLTFIVRQMRDETLINRLPFIMIGGRCKGPIIKLLSMPGAKHVFITHN